MTIRIRRSLKGCLLLALFVGLIGAQGDGGCHQMAMRIWAGLQQQIDDQQEQIDQLTGAVCELSVLTGNPTHPEFCAPEKQDGDNGGGSGDPCPECSLGCFPCGSSWCCNPDEL